jgi:hypothetical protein
MDVLQLSGLLAVLLNTPAARCIKEASAEERRLRSVGLTLDPNSPFLLRNPSSLEVVSLAVRHHCCPVKS